MHNNGVCIFQIPSETIAPYGLREFNTILYDGNPVELGNVPRHLFFDIIPELLNIINDISEFTTSFLKHNQNSRIHLQFKNYSLFFLLVSFMPSIVQ